MLYLLYLLISLLCFSSVFARPIPQSKPNTHPSTCSSRIIRKEWRQLDSHEQSEFIRGLLLLMNDTTDSVFDRYSRQHLDNAPFAHGIPAFFPWHRQFLRLVELELQRVLNNQSFAMPYWDWTLDSQAPEQSPLLTREAFGGVGQGCVQDGPFANVRRHVPTTGCIQRTTDTVLGAFYSAQQIQVIMTNSLDYDTFRRDMEDLPHAVVHFGIGGDMSTMYSPNDPLFYLHHSQMDRLWAEWQQKEPKNMQDYSGIMNGTRASGDDVMIPFDVAVSSVMNSDSLCYSYSSSFTPLSDTQVATFSKESLASTSALADTFQPADLLTDPLDRSPSTQSFLRMAQPLPTEWMEARQMNVTFVRERERELALVNFKVNQQKRQSQTAI